MTKILFVIVALLATNISYGDVRLVDEEDENLIVAQIEGDWEFDADLTVRLIGRIGEGVAGQDIIFRFTHDESVIDLINQTYAGSQEDLDVLALGRFVMLVDGKLPPEDETQQLYYVIYVADSGILKNNIVLGRLNPDKNDGDGEWNHVIVSLAKGVHDADDILFLGGALGSAMMALVRVPEQD